VDMTPASVALDGRPYQLRGVTPTDASALVEFGLRGLSDESRALFAPYDWYSPNLAAEFDASISNALSGQDLHVLACEEGSMETIVAHAFLWSIRDTIPELGIAVADGHQKRGLGKALLSLLEQLARDRARWALELTTMQDNLGAYAAYKRAGYEELGIIRNPLGCDVTAAFRGEVAPTGFASEIHMVRVLDETRRAEILASLEAKRMKAEELFERWKTATSAD